MGKLILEDRMNFPEPSNLPNTDIEVPYMILGDEAFPLLKNLMKPYPRDQSTADSTKAIYNYRLSRARRVVENAFGILSNTFRVFHSPICLSLDTIDDLIVSACILHNIIIDDKKVDKGFTVEASNNNSNLISLAGQDDIVEDNNHISDPKAIRDKLREYFNSSGSVPWQMNSIFK